MGTVLPQPSSILRSLVLVAALLILMIGLAIAQTAPPAASVPQTNRDFAAACRAEVKSDLRGDERRSAMRDCVMKKREAAGLPTRESRRAEREARRAEHHSRRDTLRTAQRSCRESLKDQRFTEAERSDAIEGCMAKSDPQFAKMLACRKQATEKKLERRTREFREHMRSCHKAG